MVTRSHQTTSSSPAHPTTPWRTPNGHQKTLIQARINLQLDVGRDLTPPFTPSSTSSWPRSGSFTPHVMGQDLATSLLHTSDRMIPPSRDDVLRAVTEHTITIRGRGVHALRQPNIWEEKQRKLLERQPVLLWRRRLREAVERERSSCDKITQTGARQDHVTAFDRRLLKSMR